MAEFKDHFSSRSPDYAIYRPRYPDALIAAMAALVETRDLAWDVGTGNGQAAIPLATWFQRVVASDASASQIAQARPHDRVEFRVARETESGLADASVNLVTVAQALHWFDHRPFYREVDRVLQPGGVLAVWTYRNPTIDSTIDVPLHDFYERRVGRYWNPERRHVMTGYRDLPFPYPELSMDDWVTTAELTRDAFLGYVGTWSAVTNARNAEGRDPVPELADALKPHWPDGERKLVTWPISTRIGRKPRA